MAEGNRIDVWCVTIDAAHATTTKAAPSLLQRGCNAGYAMSSTFWRAIRHLKCNNQQVWFQSKPTVAIFRDDNDTIMVMYDSGADGNYVSEADRKKAELPILRWSMKCGGVTNENASSGKFVT